ncbi:hypothetical protein LguiB_022621 [Lonicera macranthoides]
MAEKRLAIIVDATARMAPHWETLFKNYIETIISADKDPYDGKAVLGIIVHGANENYDACSIQPSGWTRDKNVFLKWLSSLSFPGGDGGGPDETALAQGLSTALMMFPSRVNGCKTEQLRRRHCLLVAASNPHSTPTSLLLPKFQLMDSGQIFESRVECLANIESMARSFPQGNSIQQGDKSSVNEIKHPRYLILLSDSFVDALAALAQQIFGTQIDPFHPLENFSEDEIMMLQRIFPDPLLPWQETQTPSFPAATAQPNGEKENTNSENLLPAHGCVGVDDFKVHLTPVGLVMSKHKQPLIPAQANLSPDRNHAMKYASIIGASASAHPQVIENWQMSAHQSSWSLAVNSNALVGTPASAQYAHTDAQMGRFTMGNNWNLQQSVRPELFVNDAQGGQMVTKASSFSLATSSMYENLKITQRVEERQARISARFESTQKESRGCFYGAVTTQNEYGLKRNHFNAFGRGTGSNAEGTSYPTVGNQQEMRGGTESFAVAQSSIAKTSRAREEVLTEDHERVWVGDINLIEGGQIMFVSRAVAYRKKPYSQKSVINWPVSLHVDELVAQAFLNNMPYEDEVEYIILDITSYSKIFDLLKEKQLCGYINLNGQTMILTVNTKMPRFIGTLYNEVFPLYKHQIYRPKMHLQNHQQQQHALG